MIIYFVRKSGLDSNDGYSPNHAFLTLGHLFTKMSGSSDIVYIGAGTYSELFAPGNINQGTSSSLQRYVGDIKGTFTGDAGSVNIQAYALNSSANSHSYEFLNFYGTTLITSNQYTGYLVTIGPTLPVRYHFIGCKFANTFYLGNTGNFFGEHKFFDCTFGENIEFKNPTTTAACWLVRPNKLQLINCCFRSSLSSYNALHLDSSDNAEIRNCIFINAASGSTAYVIDYRLTTTARQNNLITDFNFFQYSQPNFIKFIYNGSGGTYSFASLTDWKAFNHDQHSFEGDPKFVSASFGQTTDFHLPINSPCIGVGFAQGISSSINYPDLYTSDWEQDARNNLWDIGADQTVIVAYTTTILSDAYIFVPFAQTQTILSDTYVLAYSPVDPAHFSFPSTITPQITLPQVNTTAFDLSLKHVCNHVLSSGTFKLNICPRCLGSGFYYDIKLSPDGLFETISKISKLQQELEKITLTEGNPFHPDYGANLQARVGNISIQRLKPIIESDLRKAIGQLQKFQEQASGVNIFSSDELISHIDSIIIQENGQTGLQFNVYIITKSAEKITLQGSINLV